MYFVLLDSITEVLVARETEKSIWTAASSTRWKRIDRASCHGFFHTIEEAAIFSRDCCAERLKQEQARLSSAQRAVQMAELLCREVSARYEQMHGAQPEGRARMVGCETKDGRIKSHPETETCEVCAQPEGPERTDSFESWFESEHPLTYATAKAGDGESAAKMDWARDGWIAADRARRGGVEAEPFAWHNIDSGEIVVSEMSDRPGDDWEPLYLHPPQASATVPDDVRRAACRMMDAIKAGAHAPGCAKLETHGEYRCDCGAIEGYNSMVDALAASQQDAAPPGCGNCHKCLKGVTENGWPVTSQRMIACPSCGNKRCPKASDHGLACTGSNEPGQLGSIFGRHDATPAQESAS